VKSHTTARFRRAYEGLPDHIRRQARQAYKLFQQDPYHPGLRFKQIHPSKPILSVRAGLDYRALGIRNNDDLVWFWIGSHADYDKLIARL
jgi:hypothetical protein